MLDFYLFLIGSKCHLCVGSCFWLADADRGRHLWLEVGKGQESLGSWWRVCAVIIWSSVWGPSGRDGDEKNESFPTNHMPAVTQSIPSTWIELGPSHEIRGFFFFRAKAKVMGCLTTDRCPFFALATMSSDPGVKSMIPSFPWPTVNVMLWRSACMVSPPWGRLWGAASAAPHLPWLMLMLLILSAQMAILVMVSMTWSLCRITSPCEETSTLWNPQRFMLKTRCWIHLLFVVVTLHVQDKQAVAERADWDTCRTTC